MTIKLQDMQKPELLALADEFGVEASEDLNEKQIIARFVEDGVTQDMVDTFVQGKEAAEKAAAEEAERKAAAANSTPTPEKPKARGVKAKVAVASVEVPEQVLLCMDRENPTYKVRGYTFTREHPFALVSAEDAEFIVEHEEGFTYATPKQAREFYS